MSILDMFFGGGDAGSQTTQTSLPSWLKSAYQSAFNAGRTAYGQTKDLPPELLIPPFAPEQEAAFQQVRQGFGQYAPALNEAIGLAGAYRPQRYDVGFWNPSTASQYMNPYMQSVVDVTKREASRDFQDRRNLLASGAQTAGAFGGSRHGIEASELNRAEAQTLADIQNQGLASAYDTAFQNFGADRSAFLQSAELDDRYMLDRARALGDLAGMGQQQFYTDVGGLSNVGQQRRAYQQQYSDYYAGYPWSVASNYAGIMQGGPRGIQTSYTTGQQAQPNYLGQLAGLGIGAYGVGLFAEGGEVEAPDGYEMPDTSSLKGVAALSEYIMKRRMPEPKVKKTSGQDNFLTDHDKATVDTLLNSLIGIQNFDDGGLVEDENKSWGQRLAESFRERYIYSPDYVEDPEGRRAFPEWAGLGEQLSGIYGEEMFPDGFPRAAPSYEDIRDFLARESAPEEIPSPRELRGPFNYRGGLTAMMEDLLSEYSGPPEGGGGGGGTPDMPPIPAESPRFLEDVVDEGDEPLPIDEITEEELSSWERFISNDDALMAMGAAMMQAEPGTGLFQALGSGLNAYQDTAAAQRDEERKNRELDLTQEAMDRDYEIARDKLELDEDKFREQIRQFSQQLDLDSRVAEVAAVKAMAEINLDRLRMDPMYMFSEAALRAAILYSTEAVDDLGQPIYDPLTLYPAFLASMTDNVAVRDGVDTEE